MYLLSNHLFKRTLVAIAVLALALSLFLGVSPAPVKAQTTAELQAQIQNLLQVISELQAQLAVISGNGQVSNYVFTRNLTVGSTGEDVRQLQTRLNAESGIQVNTAGAGAPGFETTYFGPLTRAAVIAYQNKYAISILAPVGLTTGTGYFGPSTRAHINANQVTPPTNDDGGITPPGAGTEGSLTITLQGSPSNGTDVEKGATKKVAAVKVKADDSDMTVNRVDVNFNVRPWLYLQSIALLDGDTVVKEISGLSSADFTEITSGSDYRLRMTGLDINIPEDSSKILTLRVTALGNTDRSETTITATFGANSIRATDTKGLNHEEPNSALSGRTFDFKSGTDGNVKAALSVDSAEERNVSVTNTGTTENVELMRFVLEAEHSSIDVNSLRFAVNTSGPEAATLFDEIWLADSSGNRLASASTVASTTIFSSSDLGDVDDMEISSGSKNTYRLMATVADLDDFTAGDAASTTLTANTTNIVAEDADFDTATVSSATVTGANLHFYQVAAEISNKSVSATSVENTPYLASAEFKFTVTARGGDVYVSKTPSTFVSTSTTAASASLSAISASGSTSGDTSSVYKIGAGQSRTFTLSGSMDNQGGSSGNKNFQITQINWGTSTGSPAANGTDFGLESLQVNRTLTAS